MRLKEVVESLLFSRIILIVILLNAILVGLETYPGLYNSNIAIFTLLDRLFLAIFTFEIALKLLVHKSRLFKNGWDLFDFSIVALSLVFYTTNLVSVLRILRVLRVFRTISAFPSLRRLVNALFFSIPSIASTMLLMSIIYYIYGIIGTTFFSTIAPEYFGSLQVSLLTLFQIFTLDSWATGFYLPIFAQYAWAWLYFVTFILTSVFIVANLFFGELVNNAQKLSKKLGEEIDPVEEQLLSMKQEIISLRHKNEEIITKLNELTSNFQSRAKN